MKKMKNESVENKSEILNPAFSIEQGELEERICEKLSFNSLGKRKIIPLRDISIITDLSFMKKDVLNAIIKNIPLRDENPTQFPYANAKIDVYGIEPKGLKVGQTFVLAEKVFEIMSKMSCVFGDFVTKGLSKMPPAQIYGVDKQENNVMALYVPPIVEYHKEATLLDGMHRSYICSSAGTTVNAVHVSNIASKLPFDEMDWDKVRLVDSKPPINERYHNLQPKLFRDLGYVGIDG